ncbi:MAG TPA: homoserine kinase [Holophaga sp.]|jgi:homoserine kinase|nr:homoserine kinase [Holophaga sp.]
MNLSSRSARAYAPASIGNVAAGFDILGAALAPLDGSPLGDVVEARFAPEDAFTLEGPYAERLGRESKTNLVQRTRDLFREALAAKGAALAPLALRLEKHLPLSSGLGSSASSIVATLAALQALCGEPFSRTECLELAARAEGTYSGGAILDNVAPCLLGGLQMVVPGDEGPTVRGLPWPDDLVFVVCHPNFELPTAKSRAVLPEAIPLDRAVAFADNLAGLIHALHSRDRRLLARCLRDPLAEPFRADLVPGFSAAQTAARKSGAIGCSLSGSGPATFAVATDDRAPAIAEALASAFREAGLNSQTWICGLDQEGARVLA